MKRCLLDLSRDELGDLVCSMGEPSYRAGQIYDWMHKRNVLSLELMSDIPKSLREELSRDFYVSGTGIAGVIRSKDSLTSKYALRLSDGVVIEAVLMRHSYGASLCISSQAGCPMGCRFCASAIGGFERNLSAAEMLCEVYLVEQESKERIRNIDIMGTGEPLMNLEEVLKFIRFITDKGGHSLSQRNIALSTSGIPSGIRRLSREGLALTLCFSLHAADEEKRKYLMPHASRYPLSEVLRELRHYQKETGRRVTYEYILIRDENDSDEDALRLAGLLGRAHVDLIALNPVRESGFEAPGHCRIARFRDILRAHGINATLRRSLGGDIDSACGQLRRKYS